ncbi:complement factor H-like protein [Labeo rohita]|uniref:Complement factor H-like protein n=1 Tax=Labeo rohita TaxID=84645 RepID=A0A498NFR2_LABRO|nr:complement factor H-like protein [Labeo rohita]
MRVPVKLLGFGIWLLSLHCARCEECLREDIKYENTEPIEKASYPDGETVKVNCMTGYAGLYKLKCEKGKWKNIIERQCANIKCTAPDIPNGQVEEKMSEFRKGAVLQYKCNPGFKKREGIPKCAKFGWTVKPECDEVTCDLKSTTFGVKKINPEGKTIFRAGERVEITCSEKYWIFGTKETRKSFTCQYDGRWDSEPVCQEITCEVPRDQHVSYPEYYFRGDMKLETIIYYNCEVGYEKMAAEATCTEDGWTPKPLCEKKMCATPDIPNAEIVGVWTQNYRINSRIEYKCSPGFEPEEPIEITCDSRLRWNGIKQCTEKMCATPDIPNAEIVGVRKQNYRINSRIEYKCSPGFEPEETIEITCDSRHRWNGIKQCTEKMCATPVIPNAEIVGVQKQNYRINSRIEYKCSPGFEPEQRIQITCDSQVQWTGIHQCTEKQKLCLDPSLENGFIYKQPSNKENIFYSCNTGYKPFSGKWWDSVTCIKGSWSDEPRCIPKEKCGALPSVHHGKPQQTKHDGQETAFECDPGFIPTQKLIKCIDGTWEKPVCKEYLAAIFAAPSYACPRNPEMGKFKRTNTSFTTFARFSPVATDTS